MMDVTMIDGEPPPAAGSGVGVDSNTMTPRRPTFKEKVLGKQAVATRAEVVNLVDKGIMHKELVGQSHLYPSFKFKERAEYNRICEPWKECLVVKLLRKTIGYNILCEKL